MSDSDAISADAAVAQQQQFTNSTTSTSTLVNNNNSNSNNMVNYSTPAAQQGNIGYMQQQENAFSAVDENATDTIEISNLTWVSLLHTTN